MCNSPVFVKQPRPDLVNFPGTSVEAFFSEATPDRRLSIILYEVPKPVGEDGSFF